MKLHDTIGYTTAKGCGHVADIIEQLQSLDFDDVSDIHTVLENMGALDDDFEVSDYRFIRQDAIDAIQRDELSSDLYILGCFNADFLVSITDIDGDAIRALQDAEAFEGLGKMLLPYIDEIQEQYAATDGYGHHFAHYDSEEHEIGDYYVFRIS